MLRCLTGIQGHTNSLRRAVVTACVLLACIVASCAPSAGATGARHGQGEPALAASAALPLSLALTVHGQQARLRISMRNTGGATWLPAQGLKLSRLGAEAESFPLQNPVEPGQAATWDVVLAPPAAGVMSLRYTMTGPDGPFGSPARAVLVTLPALSGLGPSISDLINGSFIRTSIDWAEQTFGGTLRRFADSVRSFFDRLLYGPLSAPGW